MVYIANGSIYQGTLGSYLELPRLSFIGKARIDVNTRNNINCNFDPNQHLSTNNDLDFNPNGTGEFSLFNCTVRSAYDISGGIGKDPLIGAKVVNNIYQAFPKIVDLDVDFQLEKSGIYGMTLVVLLENGEMAFQGTLQPNVLAQDLWIKSLCIDLSLIRNSSHYSSSKVVSILSNVQWGNISSGSTVLADLKSTAEANGGNLSISMTLYYYTRNVAAYLNTNFTLAHVIGTIGVAKPTESLNFPSSRIMSFEDIPQMAVPLTEEDTCYKFIHSSTPQFPVWMNKAPFTIYDITYKHSQQTWLSVDFSNSLPLTLQGGMRDLGTLYLAVRNQNCMQLIGGPMPYRKHGWNSKGGIVDHILDPLTATLLDNSPLVVVRVVTSVDDKKTDYDTAERLNVRVAQLRACSNPNNSNSMTPKTLQQMLGEVPTGLHIRTMDYYVGRLEYNQTMAVRILLTKFGKPVHDVNVYVIHNNDTESPVLPPDGVVPESNQTLTDANGIATFIFRVNNIPFPRTYPNLQCNASTSTLPIDGQVYIFSYYADGTPLNRDINNISRVTMVNDIAILGFSYYSPYPPYTWKKDIEPIFSQYERLYPVMKPIVRLGSYKDVTLNHNLQLVYYAMSLDVNHPSYMPVTRDLSPTKKNVILQWLQNPLYDLPIKMSFIRPIRCTSSAIELQSPADSDPHFNSIFKSGVITNSIFRKLASEAEHCAVDRLKEKLKKAVQLEFATIPPYLTALYSIKEGSNSEIHKLIRSVAMQEMMHMAQAANILIAIGGVPLIDSKDAVPSYPTVGLPGNVYPNLTVSLKKMSLQHVYEVFMGIELPHNETVDNSTGQIAENTIGQFYKSIEQCIKFHGDGIFNKSTANMQIQWPWPTKMGRVFTVTDASSAIRGIDEIIEQGEGASPYDPTQGDTSNLAHFYKFEEIVCQKHLVKTIHGNYAYDGADIPFDESGVWPMKDNPRSKCIPPDNNCYTEARAFHNAFRALLRKVQDVFSGNIDGDNGIMSSITIMESMAVHARKLMWTKINPHDESSCGPVWDYDWQDYVGENGSNCDYI